MFSQTVEYALRAVVFLAHKAPNPGICEDIALGTKVPRPYMAKVLQGLVKAKILNSQRGLGGGITLNIEPANLTLLQVVNAVDPIKRITTCPLDLASHGAKLCPLHRRVDSALASIEQAFGSTTLAEILSETGGSIPLCDFSPKRFSLGQISAPTPEGKKGRQNSPKSGKS
ncbi:MAG: Rrf2 family transcriptional regulator [Planctomycetota bacterium]